MDTQRKCPVSVGVKLENLNAKSPQHSKLLVPSKNNGPAALPISNIYLKACIYFFMKSEKNIVLVGKIFVSLVIFFFQIYIFSLKVHERKVTRFAYWK